MVYGVLQVDIRISSASSLKDKRSLLRKQIEKIRHAFHISVSEVGDHDMLGNATLGFAVAGSDAIQVEGVLQSVLRMIEDNPEFEIYDSVTHIDHLT